ncbi:unnamed protein product [Victoria cruziana]
MGENEDNMIMEEEIGVNDGGQPIGEDVHMVFEEDDEEYHFEENDELHGDDEMPEMERVDNVEGDENRKIEAHVSEGVGSRGSILNTVLWNHVIKGKQSGKGRGGTKIFKCKHCKGIFHGTYTRVYAHLMGVARGGSVGIRYCDEVKKSKKLQREIYKQVRRAESAPGAISLKRSRTERAASSTASSFPVSQSTIVESFKKLEHEDVDNRVMRFLCANGIPFNVLRSPYWDDMVHGISQFPSYKAPSFERATTVLLDNEKERVREEMDDFKQKWPIHGVSIISSGWANGKNQPLINVLASNLYGAAFLHAYDFAAVENYGKYITQFLVKAIEEVGPSNVVQIVTDNTSDCQLAGNEVRISYPHIFWSPCMIHTLSLIFKDLAKEFSWLRDVYIAAKDIVKYIASHGQTLDIFRNHSKLEILKTAKRRFVSHYTVLKHLIDARDTLRAVVVTDDWHKWANFCTDEEMKSKAMVAQENIMSEQFWHNVQFSFLITRPIYEMIKFVDRDEPLIGEVYECMENMIGQIKQNLEDHDDMYEKVSKVIYYRWNRMNLPLHCLAHVLTPKHYNFEYLKSSKPGRALRVPPDQNVDIMDKAKEAIYMITQDEETTDEVILELLEFIDKRGSFGTKEATRHVTNPNFSVLDWWRLHGGKTKLKAIAVKVLSQVVTASSMEREWSTYNYIHNVKKNVLNGHQADKLVYIHSNLRLLSRYKNKSAYLLGPHQKWDLDPENPVIEDEQIKAEGHQLEHIEGHGDNDGDCTCLKENGWLLASVDEEVIEGQDQENAKLSVPKSSKKDPRYPTNRGPSISQSRASSILHECGPALRPPKVPTCMSNVISRGGRKGTAGGSKRGGRMSSTHATSTSDLKEKLNML